MKKSEYIALLVGGAFIVATIVISFLKPVVEEEQEISLKPHLSCIIELDEHPNRKSSLVIGYNYALLREYADYNGQSVDIALSDKISYIDSLRLGVVDLVVLPYTDSLRIDSVLVSIPIDSSSVWIMSEDSQFQMDNLNSWIVELQNGEDYEKNRDEYMRCFDLRRNRRRSHLSPYDDIIKAYADSISWDWRMLAAIIYKESLFHIEAQSHKGATGIMQMMPSTAAHYGVTDSLDPYANIEGGSRLLKDLSRRYYSVGADAEERFKFILAAYNAGAGRVKDMLALADSKNLNTAYWDSVVLVIPDMSTDRIDSTLVKCGPFAGTETLSYVDDVVDIYHNLLRICP